MRDTLCWKRGKCAVSDLFRKEKTARELSYMVGFALKMNVIAMEQFLHDQGQNIQAALMRLAILEEKE